MVHDLLRKLQNLPPMALGLELELEAMAGCCFELFATALLRLPSAMALQLEVVVARVY